MEEILPGLYHWTTFHEGIGQDVHSYYVSDADPPYLIDPRVPGEGIGWFEARGAPRNAYLTNRLHYRHSGRFAKRYGLTVWCHGAGMHALKRGRKGRPFEHGDELPGGVLALEVGALCPEETAFYIPLGKGVLSLGDSITNDGGGLSFVPDYLMGDDPDEVKRGLVKSFRAILKERSFDAVLFAHGEPIVKGGKKELRKFIGGPRI
ncbi:MAG: hypothetical protein KJ002_08220 [Candidatus Dadabacteria bacterium]|nr:hypothetical protein [Candidatus Dadabacteria bacterium]